jgi:EAL domain-containing protein (putative c-di-GMP-specific phosphodiesterase class I)
VDYKERTVFGFEALARVNDKTIPHIGALLDVAERLSQLEKLGRVLRRTIAQIQTIPGEGNLFINIHPHDLQDDDLFASDSPLVAMASKVVIEITERAALDQVVDVRTRIARLRELGFRIAVDDLGAGYAGLSSFANLEPDIVKLDMALVRGIDREPFKRKIVGALLSVCAELQIKVIAEGIETVSERDTVYELGCRYLQGYLFARPGSPFPQVSWG